MTWRVVCRVFWRRLGRKRYSAGTKEKKIEKKKKEKKEFLERVRNEKKDEKKEEEEGLDAKASPLVRKQALQPSKRLSTRSIDN